MPELGEVLSGVLAEVVRGRLAADTLTAQLVDTYRRDDTLSLLSVPRVTVEEMPVRLRFAVTALEAPPVTPADVARDAGEWGSVLRDRVMRRVFEARLSELSPEERVEIRDRLEEEPPIIQADLLQSALGGETGNLVEQSVAEVVTRFRAVPTSLRRRVGTIPDLRTQAEREVQAELQGFLDRRQALRLAERAHQSRLQVEITTDELQARPSEAVQEITLVLSMEDVETAVAELPLVHGPGG